MTGMIVRRALIVDPGNYTPYYDVNLCKALIDEGWTVEWWTSPYLFESIAAPPKVTVRHAFFPGVTALTRRLTGIAWRPGVRRTLKALSYPFDVLRVDRALSRGPAAVLHIQWSLLPVLDALFWRRWQRKGWAIVYTAHDVDGLAGTTPRLLVGGNRRLFRLADALIAHSERDRAAIIRAGASPARVHRLPQGVPGLFQAEEIDQAGARRALDVHPARPVILFFGLLKAYKGLDILLSSLVRVRARVPDVLLLIASMPTVNDNPLRRRIASLDLTTHVRWNGSYVASHQVGLHFAASDVVALPYRAASSSAVLLNAYAHARPVVATRVGAFPETVEHGRTGLLVPPGSPDAFGDALIQLLLNPAEARAMGDRARRRAIAHHNWSLIGARTAAIYETVADNGARARR
jgi:glycosyltransferase involved in cell wall biosynthesis